MEKKTNKPVRRLIVTLAVLLAIILASVTLSVTGQIAWWVAQICIAFAFGRICFIAGWGYAKNNWGWRV